MSKKEIQLASPEVLGRRWKRWRRLRQVVQILTLLLFFYLLIDSWSTGASNSLTDIFFTLNPLTAFTAMIAGRTWIANLGWAIVTVVVTLLVGREAVL